MTLVDLKHLWSAQARNGRICWYYRRNGSRIPITSSDGTRLSPEDNGFVEAYRRIHANFEARVSRDSQKAVLRKTRGSGWDDFINGAD